MNTPLPRQNTKPYGSIANNWEWRAISAEEDLRRIKNELLCAKETERERCIRLIEEDLPPACVLCREKNGCPHPCPPEVSVVSKIRKLSNANGSRLPEIMHGAYKKQVSL
jgi:hypothetical protein